MAQQDTWDRFWKDKQGDIVVYQRPNLLLIAWLVVTIVSLFTNGQLADTLWYIALGALAAWALLEVLKGVNYLRRVMGVVVLLLIVVAIFRLV